MTFKSHLNDIGKWLKLDWRLRRLWVRAWGLGVVCVVMLRVTRVGRVQGVLGWLAEGVSGELEELGWVAGSAVGRVPGARCLAKALVGEAMLRGAGFPAEVCYGVSVSEGFAAHAWVEVGGVAVVGGPGEHLALGRVGEVVARELRGPGLRAGGIGASMRERA